MVIIHLVLDNDGEVDYDDGEDEVREGFNNPSHGNCPLGGYPPPGAITDDIFPKS